MFGLGMLTAAASMSLAQTTVYEFDTPSADTYVLNSTPNENYGTSESMWVRHSDSTNYSRLSYVKFALTGEGILSNQVQDAEITFTLIGMNSSRTTSTMQVYGLSQEYQSGLGQDWGETDLTAANAPWNPVDSSPPSYAVLLGEFSVPDTAAPGTAYTLSGQDLADFLNDSIASLTTESPYVTFMLFEKEVNQPSYWATKENTDGYNPTSLTITSSIPEPGTMALLLGAGVFSVALLIKRRRNTCQR